MAIAAVFGRARTAACPSVPIGRIGKPVSWAGNEARGGEVEVDAVAGRADVDVAPQRGGARVAEAGRLHPGHRGEHVSHRDGPVIRPALPVRSGRW